LDQKDNEEKSERMAKATNNNGSVGRVVVTARSGGEGGGWRVLVARTAGQGVHIESATTVPGNDAAGLVAAIERSKADALVSVVPASKLVVRAVLATAEASAPGADAGLLLGAMDLVAEATLGTSTEEHRRAAGMVRMGGAAAAMTLVVGWVGDAAGSQQAQSKDTGPLGKACTWVPEAAALGALAAATPGCAMALSADRAAGSILTLSAGATKVAARSMNEDGEDSQAWGEALDESAARACTAVEVSPPREALSAGDRTVALISASGQSLTGPTVQGVVADARWINEYGTALGGAMAMLRGDPLSRTLLGMTFSRPVPHVPPIVKVVDFFSRPSRAATALAACLALALLWPLGVAWARQRVLEDKAKLVGSDDGAAQDARRQAEFYQLLKKKRWPMTKLLGDLTASLPQGITLETLTLEFGQKVKVSGMADSAALVSQWRVELEKSPVFEEARDTKNEATVTAGAFELAAIVSQPFLASGGAAGVNQSALIVTPSATETPAVVQPAPARPAPATGATGNRNDRPAGTNRAGGGRTNAAKSEKAAAGDVVPPPMTDDEINRLDRSAAIREFASRSKASKILTDAGEVDRLKGEVEKLKARMEALKGAGQ